MTVRLLPRDFDERCRAAVQLFWRSRTPGKKGARQGGSRDAVIGGKNMDGFIDLVGHVARHCGLPAVAVHTGHKDIVLPGFYRPTKKWDAVVIDRGRLLAAFEFKSQVGSFGNNFNNRSEEAIGSAADLWVAYRQGAFRDGTRSSAPAGDPRPPFLGWMMLLEDCEKSRAKVGVDQPHYPVFPEFVGASYAGRYQILCERLMQEKLYSAAALVLSEAGGGAARGEWRGLSEATGLRGLFVEFASRVAAAAAQRT
ncbi:MAG: PaeR7I family type II restriction endonuclease [Nannocystaceae bacterium]